MKKLLAWAVLLSSVTSFALSQQHLKEFQVASGKFSSSHVRGAGDGKLTINYSTAQVSLFVEAVNQCPANQMCPAVMPNPLRIELPIVSKQKDACGIRTIIAKKDARPVDGSLEMIVVKDATEMTCKTFVAVDSTAEYKTSYVDRRNGKNVDIISTMVLTLGTKAAAAPATVLKYEFHLGFAPVPSYTVVEIDVNGLVSTTKSVFRDEPTSGHKIELAQLSPSALKKVMKQIKSVKSSVILVDESENQPQCMDAPITNVSIVNGNEELEIYRHSGCHAFNADDYTARNLAELMLGFAKLAE